MSEWAKHEFERVTGKFLKIEHVTSSTIKSSPSLEYKGEAFAFLKDKNIVLRLGKEFNGTSYGLDVWYYPDYGISPKGDWVLIRYFYLEEELETLIMLALERVKKD